MAKVTTIDNDYDIVTQNIWQNLYQNIYILYFYSFWRMNIQILKFHYFHRLFIIENAVNCFTGTWLPVTRGVKIPYNLARTPLQIRTNSAVGSGEVVYVEFCQSTPQHILQDAPPDMRQYMSHTAL